MRRKKKKTEDKNYPQFSIVKTTKNVSFAVTQLNNTNEIVKKYFTIIQKLQCFNYINYVVIA